MINSGPLLARANKTLNPFTDDPSAKAGLTPGRRLLRALLITFRNGLLLLVLANAVAVMSDALPGPLVLMTGIGVATGIYLWIRRRERGGSQVGPVYTLALFLTLVFVMAKARSLVDASGFTTKYDYVIEGDKLLFAGSVPTAWLQEQLYSAATVSVIDVLTVAVYMSYFAMPLVTAVALWHLRPVDLRLFTVALLLVTTAGVIIFSVLPTAPPWLASEAGRLDGVTRIVPIVIDKIHPGAYAQGYQTVGVNDVAAFPSFHLAETMLVVFALTRLNPRLTRLGGFYAAAMGFSLIYLGEHYLVDILAGFLLGSVAWAGALRLTPLLFGEAGYASDDMSLRDRVAA